jgi:hypothetical protein
LFFTRELKAEPLTFRVVVWIHRGLIPVWFVIAGFSIDGLIIRWFIIAELVAGAARVDARNSEPRHNNEFRHPVAVTELIAPAAIFAPPTTMLV